MLRTGTSYFALTICPALDRLGSKGSQAGRQHPGRSGGASPAGRKASAQKQPLCRSLRRSPPPDRRPSALAGERIPHEALMPLRKRPTLTPELLAANRANAKRSTGPRTERGKKRVRFNAVRHGRRTQLFQECLLVNGYDPSLFDQFLEQFCGLFPTEYLQSANRVERMAQAWCWQELQLWNLRRRARDLFFHKQSRNVV